MDYGTNFLTMTIITILIDDIEATYLFAQQQAQKILNSATINAGINKC